MTTAVSRSRAPPRAERVVPIGRTLARELVEGGGRSDGTDGEDTDVSRLGGCLEHALKRARRRQQSGILVDAAQVAARPGRRKRPQTGLGVICGVQGPIAGSWSRCTRVLHWNGGRGGNTGLTARLRRVEQPEKRTCDAYQGTAPKWRWRPKSELQPVARAPVANKMIGVRQAKAKTACRPRTPTRYRESERWRVGRRRAVLRQCWVEGSGRGTTNWKITDCTSVGGSRRGAQIGPSRRRLVCMCLLT